MVHPGRVLRLVLAPALAVSVAVGIGAWASAREPDTRSSLTSALDALPADTVVAGFTDWASIRDDLGVGAASTAAGRDALTDEASLRDLTTRSVLGGVIDDMQKAYGWSAADLEWESYGQSRSGAAMVARFTDAVSIDDVEARLGELGYSRDGDVWSIDVAGSTAVGPELARTLGQLAFVPRRRIVVAADRAGYVPAVLATIRGHEPSALSVRGLADVAGALAGSDTAVLQGGSFGCRATSLDALGPDVAAQADAALARAGDLTTPAFTGRGLVDGPRSQSIRFVAAFGSPAEAADQLRVRSALATGPFIGRTGQIDDALDLVGSTTEGSTATLRFDLDPDRGAFMSGEGALLFAGCPA
ncbi:MAG: hypothetical protein ABW004_11565 [Aeromicrobium sp.]